MVERPRATLLKFPGTNCDRETARSLSSVGFEAEISPFSTVDENTIIESELLVFSGGFSYGDYIKAGRFARLEVEARLNGLLNDFLEDGGYLLGICNGFQILLELDLLPQGSLVENESRRFICRWTKLRKKSSNKKYLDNLPDKFELPIAHMEGRFVSAGRAEEYLDEGFVPLQYETDPNGSEARIAALQDETGRVLGMMPHPERFMLPRHHYTTDWDEKNKGWGHYLFKSVYTSIIDQNNNNLVEEKTTREESERIQK